MNHATFAEMFMIAQAFDLLREIDPSQGIFKDGKELLTLATQYVNLHDQLVANLDASGKSLAEHVLERRIECFQRFIGNLGRGKNIPLFYCFVLWEGTNTRWATRRLGASIGASSADGQCSATEESISTASPLRTPVLSKRLREQAQMFSEVHTMQLLVYIKRINLMILGSFSVQFFDVYHSR
jgi:hypothetical protein